MLMIVGLIIRPGLPNWELLYEERRKNEEQITVLIIEEIYKSHVK